MEHLTLEQGKSPVLISVPHAGTMIPTDIRERMEPEVLFLPDTDWFVDRLYGWAAVEGASLIATPWSRYVIDVNRPEDDAPLYEGRTTGLVPTITFTGASIYRAGLDPSPEEIAQRLETYWRPYHKALAGELDAIRQTHGHAVLLDAHSVRSELPMLFDGELPHLNLGTNGGRSASQDLIERSWRLLESSDFSAVLDGRFKGGFITRHYGRPGEGVHAIQLELAQRSYMPEFPPQWDRARAADLVGLLKSLVRELEDWSPGT